MSDHKFTQETVEASVAGLLATEAVRILMENKLRSKSTTLNNLLSKGTGAAVTLIWNSHGSSIKNHAKTTIKKSREAGAQLHSVFTAHVQDIGATLANEIWADHHQN